MISANESELKLSDKKSEADLSSMIEASFVEQDCFEHKKDSQL